MLLLLRSLLDVQPTGLTVSAQRANLIYQIALLHGLDPARPLSVSATSRQAGGLVQLVSGTNSVSLTTISAPPLSGSLDDWIDALAALHGLTATLVVTPTSRAAGVVNQTMANVGGTTTVARI